MYTLNKFYLYFTSLADLSILKKKKYIYIFMFIKTLKIIFKNKIFVFGFPFLND